jgi:hypothetical protein
MPAKLLRVVSDATELSWCALFCIPLLPSL